MEIQVKWVSQVKLYNGDSASLKPREKVIGQARIHLQMPALEHSELQTSLESPLQPQIGS
jgi:hypothetical protein